MSADGQPDVFERYAAMGLLDRLGFALWLVASAESNALEGQHETARQIRSLAADLASATDECPKLSSPNSPPSVSETTQP